MRRRTLLQTGAAGLLVPQSARSQPIRDTALRLPRDFVWGVATSACQIEGRGDRTADSIWDTFARIPGTIADRSTPDIACDSYRRYPQDIALMRRLGIRAYRFSISWPRVLPNGVGQSDARGLDYYSRVVDALLAAGIEPWVCLFHWDLPQALQDRGGWADRASADWFVEYARLMSSCLGDRVSRWVMMNEPQVHAVMGHGLGEHAPGLRDRQAMIAAVHHLNLAQGRALAALRAANARLRLGTVMSLQPVRPDGGGAADREAAANWDAMWNRAFLDPLFHGAYPERFAALVERLVQPADLAQIRQPLDFFGVNYYAPMYQRADPAGLVGSSWGATPSGLRSTALGWPIDPTGLIETLLDLRDNYGNPPVYITENGAFFKEPAGPGGRIVDLLRIRYLRDHIAAAHRARILGVNLAGYFVWTLVDNWEWSHGYSATFGLARLDRATLARIPKASFGWFAAVVRGGRD
ncbi:MAG: beta-glucosidase [Alphaproteobacteria bacterium]|nr:beta-glucosidase [Alphaproteobacteria bacterium]